MLARADLLNFLKKECEERGATIIYATHIFDGLEKWPSHIVCLGSILRTTFLSKCICKIDDFIYVFSMIKPSYSFQVYVAHGKLQLAMPMDKVKENSNLSLMVSFLGRCLNCPLVMNEAR